MITLSTLKDRIKNFRLLGSRKKKNRNLKKPNQNQTKKKKPNQPKPTNQILPNKSYMHYQLKFSNLIAN